MENVFDPRSTGWEAQMKVTVIAAAAAMLSLVACQTVKPPATASGRPEVSIAGAKPEQVKALLVSKMLDKGYRLAKDDSFNVTFEKVSDNLAANILFGTRAGGNPVVRVNYTIADLSGSVRVVADLAIISNAGMAFENRTDVSAGAEAPKVQAFLETVAEETATRPKKVASR